MITQYNPKSDYTEVFCKEFYEMLTKIINEVVMPKFGNELKMSIALGLWTSDEYGSYKISFTKDDKEVCYVIADTIFGEWEIFENK